MYIELKKLIDRAQLDYVEGVNYFFDKKYYTIIEDKDMPEQYEEPYERFIPLFRYDDSEFEDQFLKYINNKKVTHLYAKGKENGLDPFCDRYDGIDGFEGIKDQWYFFQCEQKKKLAIAWCEKHHIRYK